MSDEFPLATRSWATQTRGFYTASQDIHLIALLYAQLHKWVTRVTGLPGGLSGRRDDGWAFYRKRFWIRCFIGFLLYRCSKRNDVECPDGSIRVIAMNFILLQFTSIRWKIDYSPFFQLIYFMQTRIRRHWLWQINFRYCIKMLRL